MIGKIASESSATRSDSMRLVARLADKLAVLRDRTREELAERWVAIYGRPPPPGVRRELLCHAVAWQMQAKQLGGLATETRRQLKRAVDGIEKRRDLAVSAPISAKSMVPASVADEMTSGARRSEATLDGDVVASLVRSETKAIVGPGATGASLSSRSQPVDGPQRSDPARNTQAAIEVIDGVSALTASASLSGRSANHPTASFSRKIGDVASGPKADGWLLGGSS